MNIPDCLKYQKMNCWPFAVFAAWWCVAFIIFETYMISGGATKFVWVHICCLVVQVACFFIQINCMKDSSRVNNLTCADEFLKTEVKELLEKL